MKTVARTKKTRARKTRASKSDRAREPRGAAPRERIAAQTRKLLGKHYANKYRTGRS